MRRIGSLLVTALLVVMIGGCGTAETQSSDNATGNSVDSMFVAGMIPHHAGAIEMAELATERAERREIKALAKAILKSQQAEIDQMRALQRKLPQNAGTMMDADQVAAMTTETEQLAETEDFDKSFIVAMIPHHEGAVAMSRRLQLDGKNAEPRELSKQIVSAQLLEIQEMRGWYEDWYGEPPPASKDGGHGMH